MEKNGYFKNSTRSLLGLITVGISYFSCIEGSLIFDQPFFVQSSPFNYQEIGSIAFHFSADIDWQLNLNSFLKETTNGKVKIIGSDKKGVDANAFLSNLNTYIVLRKSSKEENYLVTISAWVNGLSEQKYSGKIPLFSQILVFDRTKSLKDVEQEIKSSLKTFVDKVLQDNSNVLNKLTFYII